MDCIILDRPIIEIMTKNVLTIDTARKWYHDNYHDIITLFSFSLKILFFVPEE